MKTKSEATRVKNKKNENNIVWIDREKEKCRNFFQLVWMK